MVVRNRPMPLHRARRDTTSNSGLLDGEDNEYCSSNSSSSGDSDSEWDDDVRQWVAPPQVCMSLHAAMAAPQFATVVAGISSSSRRATCWIGAQTKMQAVCYWVVALESVYCSQ
jgi:hypothetical protein